MYFKNITLSILLASTFAYATPDDRINLITNPSEIKDIIQHGSQKQKFFLTFNKNLTKEHIIMLNKESDSIIRTNLRQNPRYKEWFEDKFNEEKINAEREQRLLEEKNQEANIVVNQLDNLISSYKDTRDFEKKQIILEIIEKSISKNEKLIYKVSPLSVKRMIALFTKDLAIVSYMMNKPECMEDYEMRENLVKNKHLPIEKIEKYYKNESNPFIIHALDNREY